MSDTTNLPILTRLWFAFACLVRVLLDGRFARRVFDLRGKATPAADQLEAPAPPEAEAQPEREQSEAEQPEAEGEAEHAAARSAREAESTASAMVLLALLQREGRLIDFLQQDIATFDDGDVGAAARVVHEGCRKALADHLTITAIRDEAEQSAVVIEDVDASVKLTGNVAGSPPYRGTLRHRGWRVTDLSLPRLTGDASADILAPAEVEL